MKVELIYDADCPNVTQARSLLIKAFTRTGVSARWLEWERTAPESPEYARSRGSPTILVEGQDVAGDSTISGSGACRIYNDDQGKLSGTPPLEAVCAALTKAAPVNPLKKSRWQTLAASFPALGVALLPKLTCPLCTGGRHCPGRRWCADKRRDQSAGMTPACANCWRCPACTRHD